MSPVIKSLLEILTAIGLAILSLATYSCFKGAVYVSPYSVAEITAPPCVRVGLSKYLCVNRVEISTDGLCEVTDEEGKEQVEMYNNLAGVLITAKETEIFIGDRNSKKSVIRIKPIERLPISVGGNAYYGDIIIYCTTKDLLSVVNEVGIEDYLAGVAGKEMSPSDPENALKAQIIAARTFAIYAARASIAQPGRRMFDLYDDIRSQVYGGISAETSYLRKLVDETRGVVLNYLGEVFKSYYSSTCGGYTEPAWEVFKGDRILTPLAGRRCDYCGTSKYSKWSATISEKDMLKKLFPDATNCFIASIRIGKLAPGGHITEIEIMITSPRGEQTFRLDANEDFRQKLGLPSTLFEIVRGGDKFEFTGKGKGHAVGLCQVGAINMGKNPIFTFTDILNYYYPSAEVVKIY
jgi:stage II sporulation protein D